MRFSVATITAVLAAGGLALPAPPAHAKHERREDTPASWVKRDRIPGNVELPVRIGLTQSNTDKGEELLMEVSDPKSPKYGKYYTEEEVHAIFAPAKDSVDAVRAWLESSGISLDRVSQSYNKQWIQFDALTHELEGLLHTEYHHYEHVPTGKGNIACEDYHVPEDIRHHIDYITPGIKLYIAEKPQKEQQEEGEKIEKRQLPGLPGLPALPPLKLPPLLAPLPGLLAELLALPLTELCGSAITPPCVRAAYQIPEGKSAQKGNQMGIFESLGDIYSQTDLDAFWLTVAQNVPVGTAPEHRLIDGATAPSTGGGLESELDFELAYPLIYPQKTVLYQTDDNVYQSNYTFRGFLNNFLDAIDGSYCNYKGGNSKLDPKYPNPAKGGFKGQLQCGKYKPTNVISISYGGVEASLPVFYQRRQCQEFLKLGMQGVSVVVSSGDSGVGTTAGCLRKKVFTPGFPATCPFITVLGASFLPAGSDVNADNEQATTRFGSGGGFSNIYSMPKYQQKAVSTYLTKHKPPYKSYATKNNPLARGVNGIYNRAGRGYPDVSALGDNIIIIAQGTPNLAGGTSASAPIFGSILTLINEERLKAGKSTVGFVNPVLYAHPGAMKDVTVGSNPGCKSNGFKTAKGWDPVTGLGTPKYPDLLKIFMALP